MELYLKKKVQSLNCNIWIKYTYLKTHPQLGKRLINLRTLFIQDASWLEVASNVYTNSMQIFISLIVKNNFKCKIQETMDLLALVFSQWLHQWFNFSQIFFIMSSMILKNRHINSNFIHLRHSALKMPVVSEPDVVNVFFLISLLRWRHQPKFIETIVIYELNPTTFSERKNNF